MTSLLSEENSKNYPKIIWQSVFTCEACLAIRSIAAVPARLWPLCVAYIKKKTFNVFP